MVYRNVFKCPWDVVNYTSLEPFYVIFQSIFKVVLFFDPHNNCEISWISSSSFALQRSK